MSSPRASGPPRRAALAAPAAAPAPAVAFALALLAASGGAAAAAPAGQASPDAAALDAWMKLLGLTGGAAAEPVALTEAEADALLATPPAAPILAEQGGLSSVSVRFHPGEVRLAASADPEALGALLPLPPGAGAGVPLRATVRLSGEDGFGRATLVEASAAGVALPPEAVAAALLERLLTAFSVEVAGVVEGASARFPLPYGLRALEARPGEIRLTPGAPPPGG